jgi:hypothetical protein
MKQELWRATDRDDPVLGQDTAWAEDRGCAEAYLDNPGFGGNSLWQAEVEVDPGSVLDLTDDPWRGLARAVWRDGEWRGTRGGRHPGNLRDLADDLGSSYGFVHDAWEYRWIRFRDDFPRGCITWVWLGEDGIEARRVAVRRRTAPRPNPRLHREWDLSVQWQTTHYGGLKYLRITGGSGPRQPDQVRVLAYVGPAMDLARFLREDEDHGYFILARKIVPMKGAVAFLEEFNVEPEARGTGAAEQAMQVMLREIGTQGTRKIFTIFLPDDDKDHRALWSFMRMHRFDPVSGCETHLPCLARTLATKSVPRPNPGQRARPNPARPMTPAALQALFRTERARFARSFPHARQATLHLLPDACFPHQRRCAARDFARSWQDTGRVEVLAKLLAEPRPVVLGILRHELGHVADPTPDRGGAEQRADDLAEVATGRRVRYDHRDVETTGPGRWPRPRRLPR